MSAKPIVLIHGWSDSADSFTPLARHLGERLKRPVEELFLGDWVSMNDQVSFRDLRTALSREWQRKGLPTTPRSVDVVVHSTGALVVRDWMTAEFEPTEVPIHHLLMLAPANFGSPLAHKGRAFFGRIVKGMATGFETGTKILKGLELASPYTWELAEKDIFASQYWYGKNRILATVLVGNRGYSGVRAAANEDGADGTVRISTANLNGVRILADFASNPTNPRFRISRPRREHRIAFGLIDGDNHATITMKESGTPKNSGALNLMERALTVEPDEWPAYCRELDQLTASVSREAYTTRGNPVRDTSRHGHQNLVVRVRDDLGQDVDSYFLEFYENDSDTGWFGAFFHQEVIRNVHTYGDRPSYRNFYIDVTLLTDHIDYQNDSLDISLVAKPEFRNDQRDAAIQVGYKTFDKTSELGAYRLGPEQVRELFAAHRTVLLDVVIRREIGSRLFAIRGVEQA